MESIARTSTILARLAAAIACLVIPNSVSGEIAVIRSQELCRDSSCPTGTYIDVRYGTAWTFGRSQSGRSALWLTNAHNLQSGDGVRMAVGVYGRWYTALPLRIDRQQDLAVVYTSAIGIREYFSDFAESMPEVGTAVTARGFSRAQRMRQIDSTLQRAPPDLATRSGLYKLADGIYDNGQSGGPVTLRGQRTVAGMVVANTRREVQNPTTGRWEPNGPWNALVIPVTLVSEFIQACCPWLTTTVDPPVQPYARTRLPAANCTTNCRSNFQQVMALIAQLNQRIDGMGGSTAPDVDLTEINNQLSQLFQKLAELEQTVDDHSHDFPSPSQPAKVEHYVLVADQNAGYWQSVEQMLTRAQEAYGAIRVMPPPTDRDVGVLPQMVRYVDSIPVQKYEGARAVRDELDRLHRRGKE